ncbi:MAG: hypothetical protein B6D36_00135 [Planctomycetes bacterium UTPLA1]|nr:MAG: hypothetical protein B6D36_00135 [Planctomycetes bacterium UTPLA1]
MSAAHLVDHVIPHVSVRQSVLSLPIPLRLLLGGGDHVPKRLRAAAGHKMLTQRKSMPRETAPRPHGALTSMSVGTSRCVWRRTTERGSSNCAATSTARR